MPLHLLFQPNDNIDPICHVALRAYTMAQGQQMVRANRGYRERTARFIDSKVLTRIIHENLRLLMNTGVMWKKTRVVKKQQQDISA